VKLRRTRCGLDPFAMRPIVSAFRKVSAKADQAQDCCSGRCVTPQGGYISQCATTVIIP
jgi:hypothetical protein